MAEIVTAVSCPAGEWTPIAEDKSTVAFQWRGETSYGKWCFGPALPEPDEEDYFTLRPKQPANLNQLSIGAKVWAMPFGSEDLVMEVVSS